MAVPGVQGTSRQQLVVPSLSGDAHKVMSLEASIDWVTQMKQQLHDLSRAHGTSLDPPSRNRGRMRTAFVSGRALDVAQYIPVCDAIGDWVIEDVGYLMACEAFCYFMSDFWEGKGPKRMDPALQELASRENLTYEVKTGGLEATLRSAESPLVTLQTDHLNITSEAKRNLYAFLGLRLLKGSDDGIPISTDEDSYSECSIDDY